MDGESAAFESAHLDVISTGFQIKAYKDTLFGRRGILGAMPDSLPPDLLATVGAIIAALDVT